jgi:hypothetical protein
MIKEGAALFKPATAKNTLLNPLLLLTAKVHTLSKRPPEGNPKFSGRGFQN